MELIRFTIWSYNLYRYGGLDESGWVVFKPDYRATSMVYNQIVSKLWNRWLDQAAKAATDVSIQKESK